MSDLKIAGILKPICLISTLIVLAGCGGGGGGSAGGSSSGEAARPSSAGMPPAGTATPSAPRARARAKWPGRSSA